MKTQRNEKGFTLIELIVVIAIMGIIGAALVPQFAKIAKRARMSTDISTAKNVQDQIELYRAEHDDYPGTNTSDIMSTLSSCQYLDTSSPRLQTNGASLSWDDTSHKMKVSVTSDDYNDFDPTNSDRELLTSN